MHDFPRLKLSAPPSAYQLPDGYDLGETFGDARADMLAALIVVAGQAVGGDSWLALPLSFLPQGAAILAQQARGQAAYMLALLDGMDFHERAFELCDQGFLEFISVGEGDGAYRAAQPTERFLVALENYRCTP